MTETTPVVTNPEASRRAPWAWASVVVAASLHGLAAWTALGGREGIAGPGPIAVHDHAIQEHNAWVAGPMLARSGTNAGYDPYFMSGYAKSLLSSPSSPIFEVVSFAFGRSDPAVVYKATLFAIFAALPWLVAWAGAMFGLGGRATACGVGLFLLYVWTDGGGGGFPMAYAALGMSAYLLAVPLGLVVAAGFVRFLDRGGLGPWLLAASLAALGWLAHVTSPLFLVPAGLAAYLAAARGGRPLRTKDHASVFMIEVAALALNVFWWLPAFALRATRAPGGTFFANAEPVWSRLGQIVHATASFQAGPPIQAVALGLAMVGLAVLWREKRLAAAALGGFAAAGLAFGYLAGAIRALDFLQPGRQTYALFAAACLLGGAGLADLAARVRAAGPRSVRVAALAAAVLIGWRIFGASVIYTAQQSLGLMPGASPKPFLSSDPPPGLETILGWVRGNVRPGERLFYEEVGVNVPGDPDPFGGGRYSGLLPRLTGVEVIGGFYLHVGVTANFTQIGEGKLFGGAWSRDRFLRYARLYRPSAIVCWSVEARQFCLGNPDLIKVTLREGRLMAGRVVGFEGDAIRGRAEVKASAGLLEVSGLAPDLDGLVVLRYHSVPGLRCRPSMRLEPVFLENDPVPFLGLRPGPGQDEAVLDLAVPPGR